MPCRHSLLLFAALLVCSTGASAQQPGIDSLWRVWGDTSAGWLDRREALRALHRQDSTFGPAQAAGRALGVINADTLSRAFVLQEALVRLALSAELTYQRKSEKARRELEQVQRSFEEMGERRYANEAEMLLGFSYVTNGNYPQATTHYMRALDRAEMQGDTMRFCWTLSFVGDMFEEMGDFDRAERTRQRALRSAEGRYPRLEFLLLTRLFNPIGEGAAVKPEYLAYLDRAKALVARGGIPYDPYIFGTAEIFLRLDAHDCAGAQRVYTELSWPDAPDWQSYLLSVRARIQICEHRYQAAVQTAKEGLALAVGHHMSKEALNNLQPLAMAYEGLGDDRNALLTWKRHQHMRDSLQTTASVAGLSGGLMEVGFERQQYADSVARAEHELRSTLESEAVLTREKNRRNWFLAAGLVMLLLAGIFWNRLRYTHRSRAAIQKEKERSDMLLLNILPGAVAEELKNTGAAVARHFDNATILFSDFKGFTEVSEQLSPRELVEELNTCFKAFDRIITARGIEKIKTIGDAYMCAGGVPDPSMSSPTAVVHAALEMQAFVKVRKAERDAQGHPAFEMRVGIHTGPVVAGIVGDKKFQYDIWGDTVNTASRMESSGEIGQVNISEATWELVKEVKEIVDGREVPAFHFTPRGKVQAKGKGGMEMYFVGRSSEGA